MSRRVLAVLTACCVVALSATAVALAHGGGTGSDGRAKKHEQAPAKHRVLGGGMLGIALTSLAQRLDVAPADLRAAVKAVVQEQMAKRLAAAGLTPEETAALKSCRAAAARHGIKPRAAACDTAAARSAAAKLKAARQAKPDLVALKTELATSLATKLDKTPDEVLTAVRAELDARLTQAVAAGWLTQKGHDLALACFDTPATCDLKALRAEVRFFGLHHRKDGGSGRMTPGGRATSTPLR
jgi:hypothetical protein